MNKLLYLGTSTSISTQEVESMASQVNAVSHKYLKN